MHVLFVQANIPIFHHSIIPSGLHETCSIKNIVISISCRNSETSNFIKKSIDDYPACLSGIVNSVTL
jgi:hypothetical protein